MDRHLLVELLLGTCVEDLFACSSSLGLGLVHAATCAVTVLVGQQKIVLELVTRLTLFNSGMSVRLWPSGETVGGAYVINSSLDLREQSFVKVRS